MTADMRVGPSSVIPAQRIPKEAVATQGTSPSAPANLELAATEPEASQPLNWQALAESGAVVRTLSMDGLRAAVLQDAAKQNRTKLPKGETVDSKITQLYAQLLDTSDKKAHKAHETLVHYRDMAEGTVARQAGRFYELPTRGIFSWLSRSRRVLLVQEDGTAVGVRIKKRDAQSDDVLNELIAQEGFQPWDTRADQTPYADLFIQARRLSRRSRDAKQHEAWQASKVPDYHLTESVDAHDIESAARDRVTRHPGVARIRLDERRVPWLKLSTEMPFIKRTSLLMSRKVHAAPNGLSEAHGAANEEVLQTMLRIGAAARAISGLMANKRRRKDAMRAIFTRPLLQAVVFEAVGHAGVQKIENEPQGPTTSEGITHEDIRKFARTEAQSPEERFHASLLIAAVRKGLRGNEKDSFTKLLAKIVPSAAPQGSGSKASKAALRAAKRYAAIAEGYLGLRRSIIRPTHAHLNETAMAFLSPRGLRNATFWVSHRQKSDKPKAARGRYTQYV